MCDVCGLVWTNPRPSSSEVDQYYATEYRLDYSRSRMPTRRKILRGLIGAAERRDELRQWLTRGARVLDVGCGAGEFVFLLRQRGIEAAGIEPGEEYAGFSREVLRIPIQTSTVERAEVASGSQDVITMFHMLEHVADPVATLTTVRGWLAPSGRLVLEVPNVNATVQAPRHRFHYAHLYSYSAATLVGLASRAGLRLLDTRTTPDGGNITGTFARGDGSAVIMPSATAVAETRAILANSNAWVHYLRLTPYRRAIARLVRRWNENRLLARMRTMEALLTWSESLGADSRGGPGRGGHL